MNRSYQNGFSYSQPAARVSQAPTAPLEKLQKKEQRRSWRREHRYLLWCMLLPALIMYLIYLVRGQYPFGNGSVLTLDLSGQYVWFFEGLRKCVWGDSSTLYSFARALGGEFTGIFAYYIASPFSLIVCLFPEDCMLQALLIMFLVKVAISGGAFGFYMHKTLKDRKPLAVICFSICYALCAYAVVQQHNTMWIDALMWLPLLTLGIESLIKTGKYKLFTSILALTLFSNFYIGYMVCIYCVIYFFLYYVAHAEDHRNNPLCERAHFIKSLLRIGFYSLLAIGIAAVILLGAYYSLNFGKTTFSETAWEWKTNFDILDLLFKFLPGSYDTVRPEGLPFVYCGLLTLLFVPSYFLSKKYPMRQKIVSGIFVFIFVAIMSLNVTDLIMHGFQAPNWLNYRYSFMLCFYLCVLACRAFADFNQVSLKLTLGVGLLIALLCVILQKYDGGKYITPNDYTAIWFTLLMTFILLGAVGVLRSSNKKRLAAVGMVSVVCLEAFLAGLFHINSLGMDVGYARHRYYTNFLEKARPIVDIVKEKDGSFYRMEKTFFYGTNDNMALETRGLSGSTSTLNEETIQFLAKMGYASKSHWSKYLGGTPVNDSLLGLKYIISDNDIYSNYYEVFATDEKYGYTAYKNPYALSIAYGVDKMLLDFPLGLTNEKDETDSSTSNKKEDILDVEEVGSFFDRIKAKINELFGIDETQRFSEYVDLYHSPFDRLNAIVSYMLGSEETVEVFKSISIDTQTSINLTTYPVTEKNTCYTLKDPDGEGILSYTITAPTSGEIYFYLPSNYPREVELSLYAPDSNSGEKTVDLGTFNGNETTRIISLGYHEAGTALTLEITLTNNNFYIRKNTNAFYYIDYPVFEEAMATLAQDQLIVTDYTEDKIHGTFTASKESETVLTTLAYDKGWKIYVDGKEVETTKALGALIAFEINGEAGATHEISMIYRPNTYVIGMGVSLISLGIFLSIILLDKLLKRIPVLRALVTAVPPKKKADQAEAQASPTQKSRLSAYAYPRQGYRPIRDLSDLEKSKRRKD